ncbi:hypothetical protein K1719_040075 [Acacia pycnantha]|nr:hypothetical protein K1719_040075 [Acacia pycnantha]
MASKLSESMTDQFEPPLSTRDKRHGIIGSTFQASRNATIYCATEILSLDWENKSDRLLLIGTSDGCIKHGMWMQRELFETLTLPKHFQVY